MSLFLYNTLQFVYSLFQTNIEVFYKYSPIFFELLPKEMVDLWIKFGNHLNPAKLLPSMASCCHNEEQVTYFFYSGHF